MPLECCRNACSWNPVVLLLCASYSNIGICMYCRAAVQMCVYVQASSMSDMNKAERLCMVFTQFCDYNVSTLGSPSEMVSLAGCLCHSHGFVEYSKCVCVRMQGSRLRSGLLQAALIPPYLDNEPVRLVQIVYKDYTIVFLQQIYYQQCTLNGKPPNTDNADVMHADIGGACCFGAACHLSVSGRTPADPHHTPCRSL